MASTKAIYASLKMLSHNFAGDVTREKVELWEAALSEVTDEQLAAAVPVVIATYTGSFLPPVAVIREAAGANRRPTMDFEEAQKRISDLGYYNPNAGWVYPKVFQVREKLGEVIAAAYLEAGGEQIFSENETSRSIALRVFREKLSSEAKQLGLLALPPAPEELTDPNVERARRAFRQPQRLKGIVAPLSETLARVVNDGQTS